MVNFNIKNKENKTAIHLTALLGGQLYFRKRLITKILENTGDIKTQDNRGTLFYLARKRCLPKDDLLTKNIHQKI
jgi:hypothetical protein